ncbi:hypothetical protein HDZ31DRAFT_31137 [Schizophyllum fasciatum]
MNAISFLWFASRARPLRMVSVASTSHLHASPPRTRITIRHMSQTATDDHPRDTNIPHFVVRVVSPDGVGDLIDLPTLLTSIDRKDYFVELVTYSRDTGALVKVINKRERAQQVREQKQRARASKKPAPKEMQLTWATDGHDLAHKLSKARKDLTRGARVDIGFAQKSGQKELTEREKQQKLQGVVDSLQDVATEWKPREIRKHIATLFLQSTVSPNNGDS